MAVLSVLNQKGGVAKSTTSINLAMDLHLRGEKVLLCDCDCVDGHQETSATWADLRPNPSFEVMTVPPAQLEKFLNMAEQNYDFIVVDCPPRANRDASTFIKCSHMVIVPVEPSPPDVWGSANLFELVLTRQGVTRGVPGLPKSGIPLARIMIAKAKKRTRLIAELKEAVGEVGIPYMENMTTDFDIYKRSLGSGHTVFDHAERNEEAIAQVKAITDEILVALQEFDNETTT